MRISIHKCCPIKKKLISRNRVSNIYFTHNKLNFIKDFMHKCHILCYTMYASYKINLKNIYMFLY